MSWEEQIFLYDFDGNMIWQRDPEPELHGERFWFYDPDYIFLLTDRTRRFIVLNKNDGSILSSVEFALEDRLGSNILDIFRSDQNIQISRMGWVTPGEEQFVYKTSVLALTEDKTMRREKDFDGLILRSRRANTILSYYSDSEVVQRNTGRVSNDFTIKIFGKEN